MSVQIWRRELREARTALTTGNTARSLAVIDQVLAEMDETTLLTTTEAAGLLGVRSPNTIKGWVRTGYLRGVQRGGRLLIPLAEVDRIQESDQVQMVRADALLHEASAEFGVEDGLNDEELAALTRSRPDRCVSS
jgi:excisionase family DNA binding protein